MHTYIVDDLTTHRISDHGSRLLRLPSNSSAISAAKMLAKRGLGSFFWLDALRIAQASMDLLHLTALGTLNVHAHLLCVH